MPKQRASKLQSIRIPNPLSDKRFVARQKLFDNLLHGKISHVDKAEQIAAKRGLEPLYQPPDKSLYDPCRLSRWSLSMSVAWIAWRDDDRVLDADNEYRRKCSDWVFRRWHVPGSEIYEGWWLVPRIDMTISHLNLAAAYSGETSMVHGVDQAQELLWAAAGEGRIRGEGIRVRDGTAVDIPDREWRFLRPAEQREREVLILEHTGAASYTEVAFPRLRLLELWPPIGTSVPSNDRTDRRPKTRDVRWAVRTLYPQHPSPLSLSKDQRDKVMNLLRKTGGRTCPANDGALIKMLQRLRRDGDKDK